MVLVEYWGFGVRHVQLLLLIICQAVSSMLVGAIDGAINMVELNSSMNNFTLLSDPFHQKFLASLLAGIFTMRWNLKYFLLLDFIALSVQSYIIPVIVRKTLFDYLFAVMLFQGFCCGMISPITTSILARWTPEMEVGRTCSLVLSSRFIGYFFLYLLTIFLETSLSGWYTLFYIVGNLGLLWCVAWFTFGFQDPRACFYLSSREKLYIIENIKDFNVSKNRQIPWESIFKFAPLYGAIFTQLGTTWIFEILVGTTFIQEYFKFAIELNEDRCDQIQYLIPVAIPVVQLVLAFISDTLISRNIFPLSYVRKTYNSIGSWGAALSFFWLCQGVDWMLELSFFLTFIYLNVFLFLGSHLICYDITREYSGLINGLINFINFIPLAFYIPLMEPLNSKGQNLNQSDMISHFRRMWYPTAIISFIGNFIYIVIPYSSAKLNATKPKRSLSTSFSLFE